MKISHRIGLLILATAIPFGVIAQDDPKPKKEAPQGERPPRPARPEGRGQGQRGDRMAAMAQALSLSDEQKTKIKPVLEAQQAKMKEIRDDSALSDEQRRTKSRAVRTEFAGKVKAILTPEQQDKYEKMRQQGPGRPRREGQTRRERPQRDSQPKP